MSRIEAGIKASKVNKERYGEDFYKRIGALGGSKSTNGGFGQGEAGKARARIYGKIGGKISKRRRKEQA